MINRVITGKNDYIIDSKLTLRHKGLMSLLYQYPCDMDCTIKNLSLLCNDSESIVTNAIKDLNEMGYIKRIKSNPDESDNGRYQYHYVVYDTIESKGMEE